jgi:hypothetical protein
MEIFYNLDLTSVIQRVNVNIEGSDDSFPDFFEILDDIFVDVTAVVNAQGFSDQTTLQTMSVKLLMQSDESLLRCYELKCESIHNSVWRVISGQLHAFNVASFPLNSVRFVGDNGAINDYEVLQIPYPKLKKNIGIQLEREEGTSYSRSVEIELTSDANAVVKKEFKSILNSWLNLCEGGFFLDGEEPVTNAHDCPGFVDEGSRLIVARFESFLGSESAFDVVLNLISHLHSQFGCIASVRIY